MNYSGNISDWHQYNASQASINEVTSNDHNVNFSCLTFMPSLSPSSLNQLNLNTERYKKYPNDSNCSTRHFSSGNNIPNCPNSTDNFPSVAQMQSCVGQYGSSNNRNPVMDNVKGPVDIRHGSMNTLNNDFKYRNSHMTYSGLNTHLSGSDINPHPSTSIGPRNANICSVPSVRQGPPSSLPCKALCCNPNPTIGYQQWDKYGIYQSNTSYRENVHLTGYQGENRRFNDYNFRKNNFDNKEMLGPIVHNPDHRRNFHEYKYNKDSLTSRNCQPHSGMLQNYPIQNCNYVSEYQKLPYSMKEYSKTNNNLQDMQDAVMFKHQEQNFIASQKYNNKQTPYSMEAVLPKAMPISSNVNSDISVVQTSYYNSQLMRNMPMEFSHTYQKNTENMQQGSRTQSTLVHNTLSQHHLYQQKIAMQRFSMENHLRELTRIPGYQSHPKYKESIVKYKEILKSQSIGCQNSIQQYSAGVPTSVNTVPSINLQFDQNGVLINSNYLSDDSTKVQHTLNMLHPKTIGKEQNVSKSSVQEQDHVHSKGLIGQTHSEHLTSSYSSRLQNLDHHFLHKSTEQTENPSNTSNENKSNNTTVNAKATQEKGFKDFADKPELDVRQFLANWDASEDEDDPNPNLSNVVLSNTTPIVVVDYETVADATKLQDTVQQKSSDSPKHVIIAQEHSKASSSSNMQSSRTSGESKTESGENQENIIHCISNIDGEIPTIHIIDNLEINNILDISNEGIVKTLKSKELKVDLEKVVNNEKLVGQYDKMSEKVKNILSTESNDASTQENDGRLVALKELSKSDTDATQNRNLNKQNSFNSEESHNPDDISLPELPTTECTPISTTLNTPIQSDSEESSGRVSTSSNPIEILRNSPIISFTHSPIKIESYDQLNETIISKENSTLQFNLEQHNRSNSGSSNVFEHVEIPNNFANSVNTLKNEIDKSSKGNKLQNYVNKNSMSINNKKVSSPDNKNDGAKLDEVCSSVTSTEYNLEVVSTNIRTDSSQTCKNTGVKEDDSDATRFSASFLKQLNMEVSSESSKSESVKNTNLCRKTNDNKLQHINTELNRDIKSIETKRPQQNVNDKDILANDMNNTLATIKCSEPLARNVTENKFIKESNDKESFIKSHKGKFIRSKQKKDSDVHAHLEETFVLPNNEILKDRIIFCKAPVVHGKDTTSKNKKENETDTKKCVEQVSLLYDHQNENQGNPLDAPEKTLKSNDTNRDNNENNGNIIEKQDSSNNIEVKDSLVCRYENDDKMKVSKSPLERAVKNFSINSASKVAEINSQIFGKALSSKNETSSEQNLSSTETNYPITSKRLELEQHYSLSKAFTAKSANSDLEFQVTNVNFRFIDSDIHKEIVSSKKEMEKNDCSDAIKIEINVVCGERNTKEKFIQKEVIDISSGTIMEEQNNLSYDNDETNSLFSRENHSLIYKQLDIQKQNRKCNDILVNDINSHKIKDNTSTATIDCEHLKLTSNKKIESLSPMQRELHNLPTSSDKKLLEESTQTNTFSNTDGLKTENVLFRYKPQENVDDCTEINSNVKFDDTLNKMTNKHGQVDLLDGPIKLENRNVVEDIDETCSANRKETKTFDIKHNSASYELSKSTHHVRTLKNESLFLEQTPKFRDVRKIEEEKEEKEEKEESLSITRKYRHNDEINDLDNTNIGTLETVTIPVKINNLSNSRQLSNVDVASSSKSNISDGNETRKWRRPITPIINQTLEECDLYGSSNGYINPTFTSRENVSNNIKEVPVYKTKDGKITYSPNPKFLFLKDKEKNCSTLWEYYYSKNSVHEDNNYKRSYTIKNENDKVDLHERTSFKSNDRKTSHDPVVEHFDKSDNKDENSEKCISTVKNRPYFNVKHRENEERYINDDKKNVEYNNKLSIFQFEDIKQFSSKSNSVNDANCYTNKMSINNLGDCEKNEKDIVDNNSFSLDNIVIKKEILKSPIVDSLYNNENTNNGKQIDSSGHPAEVHSNSEKEAIVPYAICDQVFSRSYLNQSHLINKYSTTHSEFDERGLKSNLYNMKSTGTSMENEDFKETKHNDLKTALISDEFECFCDAKVDTNDIKTECTYSEKSKYDSFLEECYTENSPTKDESHSREISECFDNVFIDKKIVCRNKKNTLSSVKDIFLTATLDTDSLNSVEHISFQQKKQHRYQEDMNFDIEKSNYILEKEAVRVDVESIIEDENLDEQIVHEDLFYSSDNDIVPEKECRKLSGIYFENDGINIDQKNCLNFRQVKQSNELKSNVQDITTDICLNSPNNNTLINNNKSTVSVFKTEALFSKPDMDIKNNDKAELLDGTKIEFVYERKSENALNCLNASTNNNKKTNDMKKSNHEILAVKISQESSKTITSEEKTITQKQLEANADTIKLPKKEINYKNNGDTQSRLNGFINDEMNKICKVDSAWGSKKFAVQTCETNMKSDLKSNFSYSDKYSDNASNSCDEKLNITFHPKIPKMVIRNTNSCSTISAIEETSKFASTFSMDDVCLKTKESAAFIVENKAGSNTSRSDSESRNLNEGKIPIMKIKCNAKFSNKYTKSENAEICIKQKDIRKTVPKVKIKKIKTERTDNCNNQSESSLIVMEMEHSDNENQNSDRTINMNKKEIPKIPKLKLKKQEGITSSEIIKKPSNLKFSDVTPKRYRTSKSKTKNAGNCYDAVAENSFLYEHQVKNKSLSHIKEKVPKVIIKRASASAEFKCEFSGSGDDVINSAQWQPEVKLQRSQFLDEMVKDVKYYHSAKQYVTKECIEIISTQKPSRRLMNAYKFRNQKHNKSRRFYRSSSTSKLCPIKFVGGKTELDYEENNSELLDMESIIDKTNRKEEYINRNITYISVLKNNFDDKDYKHNYVPETKVVGQDMNSDYKENEKVSQEIVDIDKEYCLNSERTYNDNMYLTKLLDTTETQHLNKEYLSKTSSYNNIRNTLLQKCKSTMHTAININEKDINFFKQESDITNVIKNENEIKNNINNNFVTNSENENNNTLVTTKKNVICTSDNETELFTEGEKKSSKSYISSDNLEDNDFSVIKLDSSDESQTTIEILPASPSVSETATEMKIPEQLYLENAIPTQFELELEVTESNTDFMEMPSLKYHGLHFDNSSNKKTEGSQNFNQNYLNESENLFVNANYKISKHKTNNYVSCTENVKEFSDLNDPSLASNVACNNSKFKYQSEIISVPSENICSNDLLIKEVLNARETLKKCLSKSVHEVLVEDKPKLQTPAEKKQGSCFDLNSTKMFSKSINFSSYQDSIEIREDKTEATNEGKYKRKRRYTSNSTMKVGQCKKEEEQRKCFKSSSTELEKLISIEDSGTISLKAIKRQSIPNKIVFTPTECSKASVNLVQDNSVPLCFSENGIEKFITKADVAGLKIPKMINNYNIQGQDDKTNSECLIREDNMPVLEPEIFNVNVNSDRDSSRSPPVITNQEVTVNNETSKGFKILEAEDTKKDNNQEVQKESVVTVADIVTQLAYHKKATIKHKRYCTLCEKWFPTTSRHRRHLAGYQHRHLELTQRRTIHALFILFTGKPCSKLLRGTTMRTDCSIGELTPLQIAIQDLANHSDNTETNPMVSTSSNK